MGQRIQYTKKKPAKKDSKGPKRPLSAYMFFSQDWRERVKAENPDASLGEIGKLLGARWKELDDEEKKVRRSLHPFLDLYPALILPRPRPAIPCPGTDIH